MKKTYGTYKILLGGMVCVLTGCQASYIDVKGINPTPDIDQNMTADHLYKQGKTAFKNNDMIRALRFFKAAYGQDPYAIRTLNGLGSVYDNLRRYDLAQNYYYRALQMDPLSGSTLNNLGYSHLLQNKPMIAVDYFRKAYRIDPSDIHIQHNLMIAEKKLEIQMAQVVPMPPVEWRSVSVNEETDGNRVEKSGKMVKQVSVKNRQYAVVKVTSKIQMLNTQLTEERGGAEHMIAPKRGVGYQLNFTEQQENYADYISGAAKHTSEAVQSPENVSAKANMSAEVKVAYISRPWVKESVVRAMPQVEISNGAGRRGMAARLKKFMTTQGIPVQRLTNADHYSHMTSRIYYLPGWEEDVRQLVSQIPIAIFIEEVQVQTADIRLEIGGDLLAYDAKLIKKYRRKQ
ncbi:MAG: LytR C-terminal domain-containing protein [Emcibacter sp.]|nr:LytR C-terminal domain-containing protein [Emcibacter sp.]